MGSDLSTHIEDFERRFGVIGKAKAVCENHGDYISIKREGCAPSGCPVCARAEADRKEAKARRQNFVERVMPQARIPRRYQDKGFHDYKISNPGQQKAVDACSDYVDHFSEHRRAGRCMLLLGKLGTGKTHLATSIVNWLIREAETLAVYRTVGDILADIRATYGDSSEESESAVLKPILSAQLLVLDEVGATKSSEFELATLYRIINYRYERCLPIVIVSNLAASELGPVIGERCLDRIRENGAIVVPFDWESARKGLST